MCVTVSALAKGAREIEVRDGDWRRLALASESTKVIVLAWSWKPQKARAGE